ncbi:uncharacterized protein LOC110020436 [Phalaenopsis equestris]|uniref:uncharacterized protein LOC110020436 n=1 Tax=Phalaenopsis equestris TaxID=78828 RepID=UPI0009E39A18|nr:uncharacterized protein LOC110020436 [Phalaenopsis equestris]
MATEVCSASPRISFSHGIPNGSAAGGESQRADGFLPLEQGEGDFNFSIGFPISADHSSNADELFSNGKILPFFKNPSPADKKLHGPQPRLVLDRRGSLRELIDYSTGSSDDSASTASEIRGTGRRSFWRFGRSSSVGSVLDPGPIFSFSLNRCKSTGSFPNPARRQQQVAGTMVGNLKLRSNSNQKKTYYFSGSQRGSHGGAIRINPILNVPAPIITTGGGGGGGGGSGASSGAIAGIFAYLLCNCGGEGKRDEIGDFPTASQQNGTATVNCGR